MTHYKSKIFDILNIKTVWLTVCFLLIPSICFPSVLVLTEVHMPNTHIQANYLSPALKLDDDLKFTFKYAYSRHEKIETFRDIFEQDLKDLETAYERGTWAFVNGTFGRLKSRYIQIQQFDVAAWNSGIIFALDPFMDEYDITRRTLSTDAKLGKIHSLIESLRGKKIEKLYNSQEMIFYVSSAI